MTSLRDVGPLGEQVQVGATTLSVHGATPEAFFYLLDRFPAVRDMFDGGARNLDGRALMAAGPEAIAFVIAVTTTDRAAFPTRDAWLSEVGEVARIAIALPAHHQMPLLNAAVRLTFPEGVGPFMQQVNATADTFTAISGKGTAPATTSSRRTRRGFTTDSPGMRLGRAAQSASSVH